MPPRSEHKVPGRTQTQLPARDDASPQPSRNQDSGNLAFIGRRSVTVDFGSTRMMLDSLVDRLFRVSHALLRADLGRR